MLSRFCYINALDSCNSQELLTLNLIGKPVITYPIKAALESKIFRKVVCLTESPYIKHIVDSEFGNLVAFSSNKDKHNFVDTIMEINGSAIMLSANDIKKALSEYTGGMAYSTVRVLKQSSSTFLQQYELLIEECIQPSGVFLIHENKRLTDNVQAIEMTQEKSCIITSSNDFELALLLKNKENKDKTLKNNIIKRIKEKESIITGSHCSNSITFVGHSQLEDWVISELNGRTIYNCAIRGISSIEYKKYILDRNLLNCSSDTYIVMHGTNDIIYDYSKDEIVNNIKSSFEYIKENNPTAKIYFIKCIHVNGRLDRSNKSITELNAYFDKNLPEYVVQVDTRELDDEFGNLRVEYTIDGLHISKDGYKKLKEILVKIMRA